MFTAQSGQLFQGRNRHFRIISVSLHELEAKVVGLSFFLLGKLGIEQALHKPAYNGSNHHLAKAEIIGDD